MCKIVGYKVEIEDVTHIVEETREGIAFLLSTGEASEVHSVWKGIFGAHEVIKCRKDHGPMPEFDQFHTWTTYTLQRACDYVTPQSQRSAWVATEQVWLHRGAEMQGVTPGEEGETMSVAKFRLYMGEQLAYYGVRSSDVQRLVSWAS